VLNFSQQQIPSWCFDLIGNGFLEEKVFEVRLGEPLSCHTWKLQAANLNNKHNKHFLVGILP